MSEILDRLEDLVFILNNENGSLSDETRDELAAERKRLEQALENEK